MIEVTKLEYEAYILLLLSAEIIEAEACNIHTTTHYESDVLHAIKSHHTLSDTYKYEIKITQTQIL